MQKTFNDKVPHAQQLLQAAGRKKVGRKHNHTLGPGRAATAAIKRRIAISAHKTAVHRRFKEAVSEFWRGERDEYPDKP